MRERNASAPSIAANVWPQHAWFLNVMPVMWNSRPNVSMQCAQSGELPIAWPKPASPSSTSSAPVTPTPAASAAVTPASAARPACSGLDIESLRNACCSAAAQVAAVANACANRVASSSSSSAAAAAAPKQPMVPVLCQYL